jgi:hypothetical protein
MLSSRDDEDLVVKWLFAEAINYKNKGRAISNRYALKWASKTRVQKIIFNVLEECKIPVTRSWYKWGGFVHSDELNNNFMQLRNDYSHNPDRAIGLCKKIEALGVSTDNYKESLQKWVDQVITMPSKDFLIIYYKKEAPPKYREIYVAKQEISNFLDDIVNLDKPSFSTILDRCEKISDSITRFHQSAILFFADYKLKELTFSFTDILENSLDKIRILAQQKERISNEKRSFFENAKLIFDDYVWNPYACDISRETVLGLRVIDEKEKMSFLKERQLSQTPDQLASLNEELQKKRLVFSYSELQTLKQQAFKDQKTAQIVSELISIYSRGKDGD